MESIAQIKRNNDETRRGSQAGSRANEIVVVVSIGGIIGGPAIHPKWVSVRLGSARLGSARLVWPAVNMVLRQTARQSSTRLGSTISRREMEEKENWAVIILDHLLILQIK